MFVLEEVIQYYKNNKTDVYVIMLDASKAFDRVEYVKLFSLLLKRGLCPVICRLLIYMYTNQSLCVKWDTEISRKFSVQNGVKQGGILGYADDVVIIVPTVCSLKSMLHICDSKEFHVKFNSNKYQFLHYPCTTNTTVDNLIYDNHLIKCQSIATHLGHTIGTAAKTKAIEDGIDKFIVALNGIIATNMHIVMSNINSLKHTACLFMGVYFGTLALEALENC